MNGGTFACVTGVNGVTSRPMKASEIRSTILTFHALYFNHAVTFLYLAGLSEMIWYVTYYGNWTDCLCPGASRKQSHPNHRHRKTWTGNASDTVYGSQRVLLG